MGFCGACGAKLGDGTLFCGSCGRPVDAAATATPGTATNPAAVVHHVHHAAPARAPTQGVAVVALILNIIIWPGLGSLVAGRSVGWAQGFLTLFGVFLIFTIIGIIIAIPLMIAMWIWGVVTGVQLINEAGHAPSSALGPV